MTQCRRRSSPGWPGLIEAYRARLPVSDSTPVVTLQEGDTPLLPAPELSRRTGCEVYLKVEGANPTGSFKDRGMTMAITKAVEEGAKAVICASTGNTSASAAAYAARAGLTCAVLVPQGKIAMGKLAQALVHGAQLLQVEGNFDDCLALASKLADRLPGEPGQLASTSSASRGRRPRRSRSSTCSATPPTSTACRSATPATSPPTGRATASTPPTASPRARPRMWGFQAAGAAPIVTGQVVENPSTIATAIRIGNPASWTKALAARDESGGRIDAVTDRAILAAYRLLARSEARLRRAGVGRLGRRAAAGRRGRRARARPADRLHRHRQRAQGPGVGDLRRAGAGDHPGRRRRGRRAARPVTGCRRSRRPRPGDQRQPRAGLRLRRARARPGTTSLEFAVAPVRARRSRSPASAPASCPPTSRTWSSAPSAPPAPSSAGRRPGCACVAENAHPAGPGDGLVGRRRRRRRRRRLGAVPGRRRRSTTTPSSGWPPSSRATPTTSRACLLGGATLSWTDAGRRARRPARPSTPASRPCVLVPGGDAVHARGPRPAARRRAARRRRAQRRPRRAAGARADRRARHCCSRRPRTGCTSGSGPPRCPSRSRSSTGCAPPATPPSSPAPGPSVLVLDGRPDGRRAASPRSARLTPPGWSVLPLEVDAAGARVLVGSACRYLLGNEEHAGTHRCCPVRELRLGSRRSRPLGRASRGAEADDLSSPLIRLASFRPVPLCVPASGPDRTGTGAPPALERAGHRREGPVRE